jgi:hypothetical protein
MRRLITNPAVYMPSLIVLVTMTVWVTFNGLGPAWEKWQHERTMARVLRWSPEPWTIMVDDFPAGVATELDAGEDWLYHWWGEPVALSPWEVPGLEHVLDELPYDYLWYETRGTDAATWALNGVSAGVTDVFSVAGVLAGESFRVEHERSLYDHQYLLTFREGAPDTWAEGVIEYEAIGSRLTEEDWERENIGARDVFEPGEAGYYGNRVVVVDEATGERLEIVGVATVVDDAFVAVGTVTPVGIEPDADAAELLELLVDKVRADPPEVTSAAAQ